MKFRQVLVFSLLWLAVPARAGNNTSTLPTGTFVIDTAYFDTTTTVRFDDTRTPRPLLDGIARYEPGGGLQGTITANPYVKYQLFVPQVMYGITDELTVVLAMPTVVHTSIQPRLGWTPGNYQNNLGRPYSEADFWDWAKSMGQGKPGDFSGNSWTPADMVIGLRYNLSRLKVFEDNGLRAALGAQVAIPTGKPADPENLVAAGTTVWDLNNYGDAELHFALEKPFKWDDFTRLNFGIDLHYAVFLPHTYASATGSREPLLMTFAPYIGPTYSIDPGDQFGGTVLVEGMPFIGPTWSTWMNQHDPAKSAQWPALLTLTASLKYAHVNQSTWKSDSALWDWDHNKLWLPGDKNTVKFAADLSLMRLGLPLQLYGAYLTQELIPGRNTRATEVLMAGARILLKFW